MSNSIKIRVTASDGNGAVTHPIEGSIEELEKWARGGDARAQYAVAAAYYSGKGVKENFDKAAEFARMCADNEDPFGLELYAMLCEEGKAEQPGPEKAAHYYEQAANRGHARAQYRLGLMCASGNGGKPDFDRALYWLTRASDAGVEGAAYHKQVALNLRAVRERELRRGGGVF